MKTSVQEIKDLTIGFQSQKGEQISILKNISTTINKGETVGSNLMRKHFSSYIKGFPGASKYRKSLVTASTINIMKNELIKFRDYAQNLKN